MAASRGLSSWVNIANIFLRESKGLSILSTLNGKTLLVGCGFLAEVELQGNIIRDINPLLVRMIDSDFVEYHRSCILLKKRFNSIISQLWVSKEFNAPGTDNPYKILKSRLSTALGKVEFSKSIVKENLFNEVFNTIEVPKEVKTIKAIKTWLTDDFNMFIEDKLNEIKLSSKNIVLHD